MLLKRPDKLEITIAPVADLTSTILAMAFAALKQHKTTIRNVERTDYVRQMEEFLLTGGVSVLWGERSVTIDPSIRQPFRYEKLPVSYVMAKLALTLAATRYGSWLALPEEVDDTLQILILALRRLGAELEFVAGKPAHLEVHKAIKKPIKYLLKKESAKNTPQLVLAMTATGGDNELSDLFEADRFDYIYEHFVTDFQRVSLREDEPDDELERRLKRRKTISHEYQSRLHICGGVRDTASEIRLKPDAEYAAYLAAAVLNHPHGKLTLRGFDRSDFNSGPLGQLKRMGAKFKVAEDEGEVSYLLESIPLKARNATYEQLHSFPDSVGALALAGSRSDGTSVIRSSPFNTAREEARRHRVCEMIRGFGAKIAEIREGVVLEGNRELYADKVVTESDPICVLMAVAASLGVVDKVELDDSTPAESRWGDSFQSLLKLFE